MGNVSSWGRGNGSDLDIVCLYCRHGHDNCPRQNVNFVTWVVSDMYLVAESRVQDWKPDNWHDLWHL